MMQLQNALSSSCLQAFTKNSSYHHHYCVEPSCAPWSHAEDGGRADAAMNPQHFYWSTACVSIEVYSCLYHPSWLSVNKNLKLFLYEASLFISINEAVRRCSAGSATWKVIPLRYWQLFVAAFKWVVIVHAVLLKSASSAAKNSPFCIWWLPMTGVLLLTHAMGAGGDVRYSAGYSDYGSVEQD